MDEVEKIGCEDSRVRAGHNEEIPLLVRQVVPLMLCNSSDAM